MGIDVTKVSDLDCPTGMSFPSGVDPFVVDPMQVGNVYLLVFKHPYLHRKFAHHGIFVDVAGSSNNSFLRGVTVHLTAKASTKVSTFRVDDCKFNKKRFYDIIHVGRLIPSDPIIRMWAMDLQREGYQLFRKLTNEETDVIWSSSINCQSYARLWLIEHGLVWPSTLSYMTTDYAPVIIDVSIDLIHVSAVTTVKIIGDDEEESD